MMRPTLQARKGFNPFGTGPGVRAPYGYSNLYVGHHNGEDYFWLLKDSAERLGMTTESSKRVYPVVEGPVWHTSDTVLGLGLWQQIDGNHRAYWWHLRDREPQGTYGVDSTIGRMGATGTGSSGEEHLHFEIRQAPYAKANRINPAPFFTDDHDQTGGDGQPITESETDMPIFLGNNTVNWPNGYSNAYRPDIYEAMRLVVEDGNRDATRVETLVRESWAAVDFIAGRTAQITTKSVVEALKAAGIGGAVDAQAIVDAVVAATPTPAQNAAAVDAALADDFTAVRADVNKPRTLQ